MADWYGYPYGTKPLFFRPHSQKRDLQRSKNSRTSDRAPENPSKPLSIFLLYLQKEYPWSLINLLQFLHRITSSFENSSSIQYTNCSQGKGVYAWKNILIFDHQIIILCEAGINILWGMSCGACPRFGIGDFHIEGDNDEGVGHDRLGYPVWLFRLIPFSISKI